MFSADSYLSSVGKFFKIVNELENMKNLLFILATKGGVVGFNRFDLLIYFFSVIEGLSYVEL